jgi:glyoxylase-like metal-dependent hydrolase (beta-lactamase superfamily II)
LNIQRIKCGNGNCYILEQDGKAILVDTARTKYKEIILEKCHKFNVSLIVLTHPHIDHCQNAAYLAKQLKVPIAMCKFDEQLIYDNLKQPLYADTLLGKLVLKLSNKAFTEEEIQLFKPEILLSDGDSLYDFGINARIVALPGHTKGSIGIDLGLDGVIVGDALMNMFYPTVSMLYGDYNSMLLSAKKISGMGDIKIYFGHGKPRMNREWVK